MKQTIIVTFMLICIVFATGVFVGNAWKSESNEVSKALRQSELDTESFLVEQELFESFETNCQLAEKRLGTLSDELWKLGKILGAVDAKEKLGDDNYNLLKRKYHLTQIRTYILDKKLQQDCGIQTNVILYYFTQGDPSSAKQGEILDELVKEYQIHVFAVEYGYSKELEFLEDYYEIKKSPSLVINFEKIIQGLTNKEKIIPLLHE